MASEPEGQWEQPSPPVSDAEDSGSSSETTSYEEEIPTPISKRAARKEEDIDPDYSPTADGPSTHGSRTPGRTLVDEEGRVSTTNTTFADKDGSLLAKV